MAPMGGFGGGSGMGLMGMPAGMRGQGVVGGCVVIVSNLDESRVTTDVLFTLFGVYGDVLRVKILFAKKDTALIQVKAFKTPIAFIAHETDKGCYPKNLGKGISVCSVISEKSCLYVQTQSSSVGKIKQFTGIAR